MTKVREIASAIEEFAPLRLQESYDNAGLQVGVPEAGRHVMLDAPGYVDPTQLDELYLELKRPHE